MRRNLGSITWVLGVLSTWVLPCLSTKQNPTRAFVLKAVLMQRCQPYLEFGNENFHLTHKKILDDDGFFEKA